jgi:hypothetical protein
MDFTLHTYQNLLKAILASGYSIYTYQDWCEGKTNDRYVILRHDVDLEAYNSLATARIEAELGIRATYYFRVVPSSNNPDVIKQIVDLGHEIGYHYEDLTLYKGDVDQAIIHFEKQLAYFRTFYPIVTISMHGSPSSMWDNRDMWSKYDYKNFGIIGEPYFDILSGKEPFNDYLYFTDTGRMWDGHKFNIRDKINSSNAYKAKCPNVDTVPLIHNTSQFIDWLQSRPQLNKIMINTHPQRWTNQRLNWISELILQTVKNAVKMWFLRSRSSTNKIL